MCLIQNDVSVENVSVELKGAPNTLALSRLEVFALFSY